MDNEILFNIKNLLSPIVQEKLSQLDFENQVDLILKLIMLEDFSHEKITEISDYFFSKTGETYEPYFFTADEKDFIKNYANIINNFDLFKTFINNFFLDKDDAIENAKEEIRQTKNKEKVIVDDLEIEIFGDEKDSTKNTQNRLFSRNLLSKMSIISKSISNREN